MYIKKVIISGFKSYKDKLEFDDIDPGLNLISMFSSVVQKGLSAFVA